MDVLMLTDLLDENDRTRTRMISPGLSPPLSGH